MAKFFHVDSNRRLRPCDVVDLQSPTFRQAESKYAHLLDLFRDGLSAHSVRYLGPKGATSENAEIEAELETIRRNVCPDAPSRFQSIFAFDNIDDARRYACAGFTPQMAMSIDVGRNLLTPSSPNIWLLEGQFSFRGDMKALVRGALAEQAAAYWSGRENKFEIPVQWEHVIRLPITVLSTVA